MTLQSQTGVYFVVILLDKPTQKSHIIGKWTENAMVKFAKSCVKLFCEGLSALYENTTEQQHHEEQRIHQTGQGYGCGDVGLIVIFFFLSQFLSISEALCNASSKNGENMALLQTERRGQPPKLTVSEESIC